MPKAKKRQCKALVKDYAAPMRGGELIGYHRCTGIARPRHAYCFEHRHYVPEAN